MIFTKPKIRLTKMIIVQDYASKKFIFIGKRMRKQIIQI
jgi:hypothetical protein